MAIWYTSTYDVCLVFRLLEPVLEPREKFLRTAHSLLNISWLTLGPALKLDT